jgi:hypothetical protein
MRFTTKSDYGVNELVLASGNNPFDGRGEAWFISKDITGNVYTVNGDFVDKLAEYEDLDEKGLLLRLPCRVGDEVYVITAPFNITMDENDFGKQKKVYKAKFVSYTYYANKETQCRFEVNGEFIGAYLRIEDFGKTVFLTKSEADQALAKMEREVENEVSRY